MDIDNLTPEQLSDILRAAQDLIAGDFYSATSINFRTGLPMDRCEEMVKELSVLRNLKLKGTS